MVISELVKHLNKLKRKHGDLTVICTRCSDYTTVDLDEVTVVNAVPSLRGAEWITRTHPSMSPGEKAQWQEYVHFEGN